MTTPLRPLDEAGIDAIEALCNAIARSRHSRDWIQLPEERRSEISFAAQTFGVSIAGLCKEAYGQSGNATMIKAVLVQVMVETARALEPSPKGAN